MELDLDCQACDDILKKERGCHGNALVVWRIGANSYRQCPRSLIPLDIYEYLQAYNLYQKGILPNFNIWALESAKFISAIQHIESELAEIQNEKIEKAKKDGKRTRP